MALIFDSGALYASLDRRDRWYGAVERLVSEAQEDLLVPLPVLVEVDQLVAARLYPAVFIRLLDDIGQGAYRLVDLEPEDFARVRDLCSQYADSHIGFVDAAVLAIVERLNESKLATLDHRHFGMMRPRHVDALRLLPE